MDLVKEVEEKLRSGLTIEEALKETKWKDFESFVADIFKLHGYSTKLHVRFKTKRCYEIDIVAEGKLLTFCVDCKKWKKGRYKKSALKKACEKHFERVNEFCKFSKKKCTPLIVTYVEEEIVEESNVLVIPLWKLNSFLLNPFKYVELEDI